MACGMGERGGLDGSWSVCLGLESSGAGIHAYWLVLRWQYRYILGGRGNGRVQSSNMSIGSMGNGRVEQSSIDVGSTNNGRVEQSRL